MTRFSTRIIILDGFRAIAILMVMLFHYFSRWVPPQHSHSLYPYGDAYNYFTYTKSGVQFFFIISGFVIFFTLENTEDFKVFCKKRFIRLWPSMAIASVITFLICVLIDSERLFYPAHRLANFLPSLSFMEGSLWNSLVNLFARNSIPQNLEFISGSYWSLWVEVQFYIFAGLLYYRSGRNFLHSFLVVSAILIGGNLLISNIQGSNILHLSLSASFLHSYREWIQNGFNLVFHLPFFCIGVLFYSFFKARKHQEAVPIFQKLGFIVLLLFVIYTDAVTERRLLYLFFTLLFFIFIYKPQWLSFLGTKPLVILGQSSYFLYLIHEAIGVLLINKSGAFFLWGGMFFPLLVMACLIGMSIAYTFGIEKKLSSWMEKVLNTRKNVS